MVDPEFDPHARRVDASRGIAPAAGRFGAPVEDDPAPADPEFSPRAKLAIWIGLNLIAGLAFIGAITVVNAAAAWFEGLVE